MSSEGVERRLAGDAIRPFEPDAELGDRAQLLLYDYLAVANRGAASDSSSAARQAMGDGATGPAVLEGTGLRSSPGTAALLNAVSGHSIELDDIYEPGSLHAGVVVWPAVLAMGDERDSTPDETLAAAIVGYDVMCRLGKILGPATAYGRGFHPTGVCGVFGAAASAGRLLGLSTDHMVSALGIAATMASGSMEYLSDGAWTKRLNPGLAAADGITAARLAAAGFRGPETGLEGSSGFLTGYGDADSLARTDLPFELGEGIRMTSVKLYPCCRYIHGCVDLLIDIASTEGLGPDRIDAIGCGVLSAGMSLIADPPERKRVIDSEVDAQFSMPFAAALAITRRRATLEDFQDGPAVAKGLGDLIDRVECYSSAEIDRGFPERWASEVWVRTTKGETLTRQADGFRGSPLFPASWDDVRQKAEGLIGPGRAVELCDACLTFAGGDAQATASLREIRVTRA